ncbi:CPBP family intramembrane glutamic endopeptidase [Actinoplanes aureus]|uniref:CPBP family intramembrane metalloprotease n=1 Tax=Actinoplanes aureus TaxID=2792083 RepID=A0A931G2E2_9ACTN|nr:CPBP family intramembrane glutamic endopeptidase [Actinoplanes aureus]MBG0567612.1 CPBP family intramembrane metalloprotease [Actinoplanes aureus]
MRIKVLTAAGLVLLAAAPILLWLTGRTRLATSADAEADTVPLAAVAVPYLVGLLLIRLVPPRLPELELAAGGERDALRRQAWWLIGLALLFPPVGLALRTTPGLADVYPLAKVLILLIGAWLVLRRIPGRSGAREHRARLPRLWYWLGPAIVVVTWGYLFFYSPLVGARDLSGYQDWDLLTLAVGMLFTFVTASVLEEIFYRVILQTRLEALWGRWPAITASTLLFAVMHVHRYGDGPFFDITLLILVSNGGLGLFAGYLWSRYRNVWAILLVHGAINALALLPLFL